MLLIGCDNGCIVAFDMNKNDFVNFGNMTLVTDGQVGIIIIKSNNVVLCTSTGKIVRYPIDGRNVLPPEDPSRISEQSTESAITALVMDDMNVEGILGTSLGNIHYVNLAEKD